MPTTIPTIELHNQTTIPQLGLGVWRADTVEAEQAVSWALAAGYRLIDTAMIYQNEDAVGRAIAASNIPRSELYITTKLWNSDQGYDSTLRAFDASLDRLGLEYLDLYLIHWPIPGVGKFIDTWKAFEKLLADGRVRSIGVSNFRPEQLQQLLASAQVPPVLNQIELHPYFQQVETRKFCADHNIAVESWSPLGGSKHSVLNDAVLADIAAQHSKTAAQIVLRWHVQSGHIVIPKSVHQERIAENAALFDFELTPDDMTNIASLDKGQRNGPDPATMNVH